MLRLVLFLSLLTPLGTLADDAALDQAVLLIEQGKSREAELLMRNTLEDNPDDLELRYLLGKLYVDENAPAAGERELRAALAAGLPADVIYPILGRALLLQEKFQQVLDELTTTLQMSESVRSRILTHRAMAHAALGDRVTARRNLDSALILDRDNRDAQLGKARLSLIDGQFAAAERFVRPLLATYPDCAECWEAAGELAQQQGRTDEAEQAFSKAVALDPDNFLALLGRAAISLDKGDLTSAELILENARKLRPQDPMIAHLGANLALRQGDLKAARGHIDVAVDAMPEHIPSLLIDGLIARREGRAEEARTRLRRVLSSLPSNVDARTALAALEHEAGNHASVITLLEPIVASGDATARTRRLFGGALLKSGEIERARTILGTAIDASPALQLDLGAAQLALGEVDAGIARLRDVAERQPTPAAYYLGIALLGAEQLDAAAAVTAELLQRHPESAAAHNLAGTIALAADRRDDALAAFRRALELAPTFAAAQLNLSRAALAVGDMETALTQLRALVQSSPGLTEARLQLARIAALRGDKAEAYSELDAIQKARPGELTSGRLLVENRLRDGDIDRAQSTAFQVLDTNPENPHAIRLLARARIAAGYFPEASALLAKRVEQPDAEHADWLYYAEALLGERRVNEAIDAYQRAAILSPRSDLRAAMRMTRLQAATARETDAKRELRRLVLRNPLDASPNEMLGDILRKEGDRAGARNAYAKAMRLEASANLLIKLYRSRHPEQPFEEALAPLRDWLEIHPDDLQVRLLLATELDRANDAGASREYDAVLQKDPDNVIALNNLAMRQLGDDPAGALKLASRAFELEPGNPVVMDTYAQSLIANERASAAIPLLQDAIDALRTEPALRFHLAAAHERAGNFAEARAQIRRLLITYADFADKDAAVEMLERLRVH